MKKPILLIIILCLSACKGWTPLYGTHNVDVSTALQRIYIAPADNITDQYLYNALLDQLAINQPTAENRSHYQLHWALSQKSADQAKLSDDSTAIVQVTYRVDFSLHESTGEAENVSPISFRAMTRSLHNTNNSMLSNDLQQQKSAELALERLARTMVDQLAVYLRHQLIPPAHKHNQNPT